MKVKKQKGELLVETIVAMSIFALSMLIAFKVFSTFSTFNDRKREYAQFESVCFDIDNYYDSYGKDYWAREYFGEYYNPNKIQKYNSQFELVESQAGIFTYALVYDYNNFGELQLAIVKADDGYKIEETYNNDKLESVKVVNKNGQVLDMAGDTSEIKKSLICLNYGASIMSTSDSEYYQNVLANNMNIKNKKKVDPGEEEEIEERPWEDDDDDDDDDDHGGGSGSHINPDNPFNPGGEDDPTPDDPGTDDPTPDDPTPDDPGTDDPTPDDPGTGGEGDGPGGESGGDTPSG